MSDIARVKTFNHVAHIDAQPAQHCPKVLRHCTCMHQLHHNTRTPKHIDCCHQPPNALAQRSTQTELQLRQCSLGAVCLPVPYLSLTEQHGSMISSLAATLPTQPSVTRFRKTIGVLPATGVHLLQRRSLDETLLLLLLPDSPISWVTFSAMFSVGACVAAALPLIFLLADCAAPYTQGHDKRWVAL